MSFTQHFIKCVHEFYSTLCKVCTWVLLNTLLQFHKFFHILCLILVFNNVNTVRSEMWVWGFPNHSYQKFLTNHPSSTRDLTIFLETCCKVWTWVLLSLCKVWTWLFVPQFRYYSSFQQWLLLTLPKAHFLSTYQVLFKTMSWQLLNLQIMPWSNNLNFCSCHCQKGNSYKALFCKPNRSKAQFL